MKVLLFAGTSEGRKIASTLSNLNIDATVCVATDYGADILSDITNINLIEKRQDQNDIENLLEIHDIVIDATHPYALDISNNILKANEVKQKKYYRIIREFVELDNAIFFDDYSQLTHYLNENDGNALVTTGSKAIIPYTLVNDYKERLFFRVLPMIASLEQCYRYGIKGSHIIAMQGPFSIDLNKALLKQYNCQYLISKNTGKSGGMEEKLQATKEMDIKLLIVSLEQEQGYRIDDMIEILENI